MVEISDAGNARMTASEQEPDGVSIILEGELDIASVELIRRSIEPYLVDSPQHVVFDLARLQFMDSSGIALLIEVANRVGSVETRNATPIVRRALEVTGLVDALGVTD
jgi:anti-sigma B factor antagonist